MSTADLGVTLPRVINSEWIKFRSLRSTVVTLLVGVALVVGLGLLITSVSSGPSARRPNGGLTDPTSLSLSGVTLASLALAVLGVLNTAGEYSTGTIRGTLSAVPARLPVLWAKTVVFAAVTFVPLLVSVIIAFLFGQAILSSNRRPYAAFFDPGVPRAVIGAAVYLTGAGLIGLAAGALVRNTAGAIATVVGALFLVPGVVQLLPRSWNDTISPYLPSNAGGAFTEVTPTHASLAPWVGLGVYAGYIVALFAAAAVLLMRRDA